MGARSPAISRPEVEEGDIVGEAGLHVGRGSVRRSRMKRWSILARRQGEVWPVGALAATATMSTLGCVEGREQRRGEEYEGEAERVPRVAWRA